MYTKAQKQASRKYNEKAYDRIYLTVKKGQKEKIKSRASELGMSLNAFIAEIIGKNL